MEKLNKAILQGSKYGVALAIGFLSMTSVAQTMGDAEREWQQNVVTSPTPVQLSLEQKGHIVILDGMTDKEVESIMNSQFERLGSFMFTRVIKTDHKGNPRKDPKTGELVMENDGC